MLDDVYTPAMQNHDHRTYIPLFPNVEASPRSELIKDETRLSLKTGDLSVDITTNPFTLTFKTPVKPLAVSGYRHQGLFDVPFKWTMK